MEWIEIEEVTLETDDFDLDAWHNYWMDVSDPRGKYLQDLELHIMTGGGYY